MNTRTFRRAAGLWLATTLLFSGTSLASEARIVDTELGDVRVVVLQDSLEHPWALAFLPQDGGMLVTERPGRLRHIAADGTLGDPITGVPEVFARGQGGLLDVALAPDFDSTRHVYLAWAQSAGNNQASTAVGYGRLSDDLTRLEDFTEIFRQTPAESTGQHFGARLVFDHTGQYLYIALGEHNQRSSAQDLTSLQGKVVRLHPDGSVPTDNPFVNDPEASDAIWSYGHRNPQGAVWHPLEHTLWIHEHGPRGGDEINIPQAGLNYGWPLATHGRNYTMLPIPEARGSSIEGAEDPWHVWADSPAVSGMAFYTDDRFAGWHGNLFVGALKDRELLRLTLNDGQVVAEERLLGELNARIRDVRAGPDGLLYVLTDASPGALWRLEPAGDRWAP